MIRFTLSGIPSPKKNGKRWIARGGKKYLVPSENHEVWHYDATVELLRQIGVYGREMFPVEMPKIEILFYTKDKKRRDSTNCADSVMDLLVDLGIIKDDNMVEVSDLRLVWGGVIRDNPYTEIRIYGHTRRTE